MKFLGKLNFQLIKSNGEIFLKKIEKLSDLSDQFHLFHQRLCPLARNP